MTVLKRVTGKDGCGEGLRGWINSVRDGRSELPTVLSRELIEVYLSDPEALPLHDCEGCGVAIPIRPDRLREFDSEPEMRHFEQCPECGGRTGPYFFISGRAQSSVDTLQIRRAKPR